jgi:predicted transcriptional regulator
LAGLDVAPMTPRMNRSMAYDHFGEFLRRLVEQRSAREVAHYAGVNHSTITRILKGSDPHLSTAKAVIDRYAR